MTKYTLISVLFLIVLVGCNALGIKESDNTTTENADKTSSLLIDNQTSANNQADLQAEQITQMQSEIDELISTLNTKDMAIVELETKIGELNKQIEELNNKVTISQSAYDNLQGLISTNNQYRNIAIIVAIISILLNILLVYMLIKAKSKYSRAALPPAKKDEHIVKNDQPIEKTDMKTVDSNDNTNDTNSNQINNDNAKTKKEAIKKEVKKTASKEETATIKKRGRPKKDTTNL